MGSGLVFAEKQEWFDSKYNFKKVKKVLIYPPSIPDSLKNGIIEKDLEEVFWGKALLNNIEIINASTLIELLTKDTGIDIKSLYKTDEKKAIELLHQYIPNYADIVVCTNILNYETDSEYREGYSYTTTEYQTSYIYGPAGTATIQTPVNKTHNVPGGNILVLYTGVRFDVFDTLTNKVIFSRIDNRSKNPTILESSTPKNMYKRILKSFFNDLETKIKS